MLDESLRAPYRVGAPGCRGTYLLPKKVDHKNQRFDDHSVVWCQPLDEIDWLLARRPDRMAELVLHRVWLNFSEDSLALCPRFAQLHRCSRSQRFFPDGFTLPPFTAIVILTSFTALLKPAIISPKFGLFRVRSNRPRAGQEDEEPRFREPGVP